MTLLEMVAESATEHQLAEALYDSELKPTATELLAALKQTYDHPYGSYSERWELRHAREVLETVAYLKAVRS
ncbi:hypothetical protein N8739_00665 [Luminiphilus sp.]|nr:hypothetical protein [Luminiphilus sp.]